MASSTPHPSSSKRKQNMPVTQPTSSLTQSHKTAARTAGAAKRAVPSDTTSNNQGAQSSSPVDPNPGIKNVYWEPHPHLTDNLLAWLLDHPADRTILFYDKSNRTLSENSTSPSRASGTNKKEIHAVIAQYLFKDDTTYGSAYAIQPDKFATAIASRLASLKDKYRTQLGRLKSTGAGVAPSDPKAQNLMQSILQAFPHFHECHNMWSGNPSYDSKPFNGGPSVDRTEDFLSLIKRGSGDSTARPHPRSQAPQLPATKDLPDDDTEMPDLNPNPLSPGQENPPSNDDIGAQAGDDGTSAMDPDVGMDCDVLPDVPIGEDKEDEEEEEEDSERMDVEEDNEGPGFHDFSPVQGTQRGAGHLSRSSHSQVGPIRFPAKPRTPSYDARTAFRPTPYSRPPSSVSSMTSSLSRTSQRKQQATPPSHSSQTSSTKGKSAIEQMKDNFQERLQAVNDDANDVKVSSRALRSERYIAKLNYHMREREINYLETERTQAKVEMEEAHRRQLEIRKSDIELQKADAEVLEQGG
ncbi:hypothetical protein BU15DRAFT_71165 [Melanogaster broomeanus]|nr:hypothetical protein BU15DRAFT_71165 [Melanogaster broomeanus]